MILDSSAEFRDKEISCQKADKVNYGLLTKNFESVMMFGRWRQQYELPPPPW